MELTRFDIGILVTMSFAIILMSFTFPAAGLADQSNETTESEVPELNITADRFDFAGERPDRPGTPTQGTLFRNESKTVVGDHQAWLEFPESDGVSIDLANLTINAKDDEMQVVFTNFSGGSSVSSDKIIKNISSDNDTFRFTSAEYGMYFDVQEYKYAGTANMTAEVDWEVRSAPDDAGGLSALPVVGGIFSTGETIVAGLAYIGAIIRWGIAALVTGIANTVAIVADAAIFLVSLLGFLTGSYTSIVAAASSWAAVLLLVPLLLLFAELGKIAFVGVGLVR